jgi:hypothetical protein
MDDITNIVICQEHGLPYMYRTPFGRDCCGKCLDDIMNDMARINRANQTQSSIINHLQSKIEQLKDKPEIKK